MATLSGLFRLGRDAELRYTADGVAVASLALAYNYGKKQDNKQPSQWMDAAIFGKRAEALAPHLTKGSAVVATLDDVYIKTFTKGDGSQGTTLSGRVLTLEFAGKPNQSGETKATAKPTPSRAPGAGAAAASGPGHFEDDDIPFAPRSHKEAI